MYIHFSKLNFSFFIEISNFCDKSNEIILSYRLIPRCDWIIIELTRIESIFYWFLFFFLFYVSSRVTTLLRCGCVLSMLAQYIGPACFNVQQFSKNSSHNFSHFARKLCARRKLHAHPWYTIFTGEGVTPYNTKIRFGIVSRGENTKEIGNIASTRFLRKREPRVLSERGIVQRARDNRGRPFRKFDGMRSPSAKRRHPGETFYVWVVIYLLDRNTIAFHLEILVQYPRYNFVGRIFGRERERERENTKDHCYISQHWEMFDTSGVERSFVVKRDCNHRGIDDREWYSWPRTILITNRVQRLVKKMETMTVPPLDITRPILS